MIPLSASLDASLALAADGFSFQQQAPLSLRAEWLGKIASQLENREDALAALMAVEMGKPVKQGRAEVAKCASVCRYYASEAEGMLADIIMPAEGSSPAAMIVHQPLGVILAIMPWNFPLWQVFRFAAPALMAGNTVALKHASIVPGCAREIAAMVRRATGRDDLLVPLALSGKEALTLMADPRIHAVTFTGSTDVGREVAAAAGRWLKKSVLELGGSDPYLVMEDADPVTAARICAAARMVNAGQSCVAGKRFLVHHQLHDRFVEAFRHELATFRAGDPLEEETTLGPLARPDLRDALHAQVTDSVRSGARLELGGTLPPGDRPWYPATLLVDVQPGMRAFDEETFGPVAAVTRYRDLPEGIRLAGLTSFGLGAGVISSSPDRAREVALQLQAGTVAINAQVASDPRLPFGGIRDSGWGRELGAHGIREFVNVKTITGI